jgi:hypothetical protein
LPPQVGGSEDADQRQHMEKLCEKVWILHAFPSDGLFSDW